MKLFIVGAIFTLLTYVPITWMCLNNIRLKGLFRHIFSFTAFPIFLIGMAINIYLGAKIFDGALFEYSLTNHQYIRFGPADIVKIIMIVPVGLLFVYAWYMLINKLSNYGSQN